MSDHSNQFIPALLTPENCSPVFAIGPGPTIAQRLFGRQPVRAVFYPVRQTADERAYADHLLALSAETPHQNIFSEDRPYQGASIDSRLLQAPLATSPGDYRPSLTRQLTHSYGQRLPASRGRAAFIGRLASLTETFMRVSQNPHAYVNLNAYPVSKEPEYLHVDGSANCRLRMGYYPAGLSTFFGACAYPVIENSRPVEEFANALFRLKPGYVGIFKGDTYADAAWHARPWRLTGHSPLRIAAIWTGIGTSAPQALRRSATTLHR